MKDYSLRNNFMWFFLAITFATLLFWMICTSIGGIRGAELGAVVFIGSLFGLQYLQPDYILKKRGAL